MCVCGGGGVCSKSLYLRSTINDMYSLLIARCEVQNVYQIKYVVYAADVASQVSIESSSMTRARATSRYRYSLPLSLSFNSIIH